MVHEIILEAPGNHSQCISRLSLNIWPKWPLFVNVTALLREVTTLNISG